MAAKSNEDGYVFSWRSIKYGVWIHVPIQSDDSSPIITPDCALKRFRGLMMAEYGFQPQDELEILGPDWEGLEAFATPEQLDRMAAVFIFPIQQRVYRIRFRELWNPPSWGWGRPS